MRVRNKQKVVVREHLTLESYRNLVRNRMIRGEYTRFARLMSEHLIKAWGLNGD